VIEGKAELQHDQQQHHENGQDQGEFDQALAALITAV
jgi:hypothetical protein